jgi:hypothetical protein
VSTATRTARTSSRPSDARANVAARAAERRRAARPVLREVPQPAPAVAGTGIFALVVTGLLVGGMVLLLVLNTSLAQGAFEIGALTKEQRQLAVTEQRLLQEVAVAESPESLQREARRLGMVASVAPVFLRLADGKVLGTPQPADAVAVTVTAPRTAPAATGTQAPSRSTSRPASTPAAPAAPAAAAAAPATAAAESDAAVADPAPQSDAAVPDTGSTR